MKTIEILAEEHRVLFRVLASLERLLEEANRSRDLDDELATSIVDFLERFADGCHQDKEEEFLFLKLMQTTPAEMGASIRELLGIHEGERKQLAQLRGLLEEAARGDIPSRNQFIEQGHAYIVLQRDHIDREERVLLPLARKHIGRADDAEMLLGFRRIDERYFGPEPFVPKEFVDAICARIDARYGPRTVRKDQAGSGAT